MNVPQRLTRLVSAALIAAALIAPTAVARPAGPDPPSSGDPGSVAPIDHSARSHSTDRKCAAPNARTTDRVPATCPGDWLYVGAHEPATLDPVDTVVSSRTRRCGDLLVASERLGALPSCPGGWHLDAGHQEHRGRDDQTLGTLPCTPACDPGVPAHLGHARAGLGSDSLAASVAKGRLATAKYVSSLRTARADGYRIITRMIPGMGFHFMNARITGFDVSRPPILVYEKRGQKWQLAAFEWVFPSKPKTPPLPGARYGSFGAACHFVDGTFVAAASEAACAKTAPGTGAAFGFWHPDLVTLHLWLWFPNPSGLFASMNPLVRPFNGG